MKIGFLKIGSVSPSVETDEESAAGMEDDRDRIWLIVAIIGGLA